MVVLHRRQQCRTRGLRVAAALAYLCACTCVFFAAAATRPNATITNQCFIKEDCPDADSQCSFASPKSWCQCNSATGVETCAFMGTCTKDATCTNCATCVAAVSSFVRSQQKQKDAAAVAAAWTAQQSSIAAALGSSLKVADAAAVATAIANSYQGNLGKRAGSLCTQMQCRLGRGLRRCSVFSHW